MTRARQLAAAKRAVHGRACASCEPRCPCRGHRLKRGVLSGSEKTPPGRSGGSLGQSETSPVRRIIVFFHCMPKLLFFHSIRRSSEPPTPLRSRMRDALKFTPVYAGETLPGRVPPRNCDSPHAHIRTFFAQGSGALYISGKDSVTVVPFATSLCTFRSPPILRANSRAW